MKRPCEWRVPPPAVDVKATIARRSYERRLSDWLQQTGNEVVHYRAGAVVPPSLNIGTIALGKDRIDIVTKDPATVYTVTSRLPHHGLLAPSRRIVVRDLGGFNLTSLLRSDQRSSA